MIKDLREKHENVLLVDSGDFFWQRKLGELRADTTVKALRMMRYDALNVADGELSFGLDFLEKYAPKLKRAFLSSNVSSPKTPPWQPFLIKKFKNGLRVAVLGLVSSKLVNQARMREDGISIEDPSACLKRLLPDIRKKADLVLVLSHLNWEPSKALVEEVPDVDMAIVGHAYYPSLAAVKLAHTIMLKNTVGGKQLGVVKIWLNKEKRIEKFESSLTELTPKIHVYPEYTLPESEFRKKRERVPARKEKSGKRTG